MHVLTFNSGSSSLKFGLYRVDGAGVEKLVDETVEDGGSTKRAHAMKRVDALLDRPDLPPPDAVGHRIVHGGMDVCRDCVVDDTVLRKLEAATRFAPLHLPPALAGIRFARQRLPGIPQVACLDTAFHSTLDEVARRLPLPKSFDDEGVRRYGFHGLSCASIVRRLGDAIPKRMVIAHLGNGASVTALRGGRSVDTSMGLTPTGGMLMGTRSGDIDPGVMIHLMRSHGLDAEALEVLFARQAGLAGVSGIGGDMRVLRAAAVANPDARLAIAMFCHALRKQIAAMAAALGGIDSLIFSGGIGEHDAPMRSEVCADLAWMGIELDEATNALGAGVVSRGASRVEVRVVVSQENEQIALQTGKVLAMP